ncbi:AraC family transcriptional regulator [Microvirga puerhi]|uniref:AraC family transcriptional regulator n=1 Tax=Microvirga puerhi TaxID=2876078 RepID=A0ABS7VPE9_9HYPH|nr:AraC family transcriptional regulator [Microvirga puerhi]MBZ6077426.1 AraC family transcriptional regulator [Microvirga puerhi]
MTDTIAPFVDHALAIREGGVAPSAQPKVGGILDFVYKSSRLDEIEDTVVNFISSPHSLVPVTRGARADGSFSFHGMDDLAVFNVGYGRELAVEYHDQPGGRLAIVMAPQGLGQLEQVGKTSLVSDRQAVVFSSGEAQALRYSEDGNTQVLVLDHRKIASCCAKLLGREIAGEVAFETEFDLTDVNGQSWMRLFHYLSSELSAPFSLIRDIPAARQQLEQMAITGFLLSHRHSYTDALLRPQQAVAPFYVKRAEAFIEAHFAAPLSLADIAAHAGVSARSLQNGFQNFRGMTPMAFLRSVRLQHAHRALLVADPAISTVTQIALACGFTHLGEFGTIYRRMFGETPGRTLQRSIRS